MGETAPEQAKALVDAVAWGEHHKVWDLLSEEGRRTVLRVGAARGMDEGLAARLREGTASAGEQEEFLADLVNGLRADLAGNDLDALEAELDSEPVEEGRARVILVAPLPEVLSLPGLPVATVEMREEGGGWRVDRLIPRTTQ
jgi:hypothetical protein